MSAGVAAGTSSSLLRNGGIAGEGRHLVRAILGERTFLLFWTASGVSLLGDWILWSALPFAIYRLTGSALATGAMFVVQTVPALLLGLVAGVFVDRWDRRRVVIAADLACAALLLPLLALPARDTVWLVYAVGFLLAGAWQFYLPASSAPPGTGRGRSTPGRQHLERAHNERRALDRPAPRGARVRRAWPCWTCRRGLALLPGRGRLDHVFRGTDAGAQVVRASSPLAVLFTARMLTSAADSMYTVLFPVWVITVLQADVRVLGWLLNLWGVGGLLGGFLLGRLGRRARSARLVAPALAGSWFVLLASTNARSIPIALALAVAGGIPSAAWAVSVQTLLQRATSDAYRGRVFGTLGTTTGLLSLGGFGLATVFGDRFGAVLLINLAGACGFLAAASLLRLGRPDPPTAAIEWAPEYMSRSFLRMSEQEALEAAAFTLATDPRPSRRRRRARDELEDAAPPMVDVHDLMDLDGVTDEQHVTDYLQAVVGEATAAAG